jgi:tRNA(Arg) A34 adenosine deaminase TadA
MSAGTMTKDEIMRYAIELSRREMRGGNAAPFAAVIVRDGVIVGEGCNHVVRDSDPTAHGEVDAIRDACRKLGTWDLSGCEIYTTCEPCEMCLAAMFWAKLDRMYYANRLTDAEALGFDLTPLHALVRTDLEKRALTAGRLCAQEARAVLDEWAKSPAFDTFQGRAP